MIGLSNAQLETVMATAAQVPYEKRGQFLERIAAMLALRRRGHFTHDDVDENWRAWEWFTRMQREFEFAVTESRI
jgi:hypothetical protein